MNLIIIGLILLVIGISKSNRKIEKNKINHDISNSSFKKPLITHIDENGYRRFNKTNKLVHRWIMEKQLGRKLYRYEVVHHIDRNKLNNSPYNLQVMSREQHNKIHEEYLTRIGAI